MRKLISGIVGLVWGGFILIMSLIHGGPQGEGGAYAGAVCGLVHGILFFVFGAIYLFLGIRELQSEARRQKRRRRRPRKRRRRAWWDEDD
jgi:hypothetical protein